MNTTINQMLSAHKIFVPSYLPAYSWETPSESKSNHNRTHTNIFLQELIDYIRNSAKTPYYYGQFLFIQRFDKNYFIIDGQDKLTTIVILLSALFSQISRLRYLTEEEIYMYKRIVKLDSNYAFTTVCYDNQVFIDYVINQIIKDKKDLKTESARRIVRAFDYFKISLTGEEEHYLTKMLKTLSEASCTIVIL